MSVPLFGSVGDLFNRLGKLGAIIADVSSAQQTLFQAMTNITTGAVAQYNAESDIQALIGQSYIGQLSSLEGPCQLAAQVSQTTINRMVFRSQALLNQTLQGTNLLGSIQTIIDQMLTDGDTVLAMTVTGAAGSFVGTGNGIANVSVRRPSDGRVCENAFAEIVTLTVTSDSYNGSATAGNEGYAATGQGNQPDVFAFNWPLGSNCQISSNAIDGTSDNSNGNIGTNSDFEDWTVNVPSNYTTVSGAGIIFQENTIIYTGTAAMRLTGDGVTLANFTQTFDSSSGTLGTLSPQTQYSFNIFMRRDGVAAGVGLLNIELIDQNGNVIADDSGNPNTFQIDLTALTTNYASFTADFRTPSIMPTSVLLRFANPIGAALSINRSVYLDDWSLGLFSQLYTSGPSVAVHSGNTPFQIGDAAQVTITNSFGAGGTKVTWQVLWSQIFPMRANDLLLPSSNVPNVSDNLIA